MSKRRRAKKATHEARERVDVYEAKRGGLRFLTAAEVREQFPVPTPTREALEQKEKVHDRA